MGWNMVLHLAPRCHTAVVREARAHFNCPDLEGAELEDQVGWMGWNMVLHCAPRCHTAVVREARAHFNCPDLEGAELVDQVGLDGVEYGTTLCTSLSHCSGQGGQGPLQLPRP